MKKNIVTINQDLCKGCRLCIVECPQKIIKQADSVNSSGYHPAEVFDPSKCTGCRFCAIACPEAIIEVEREEDNNE